MSTGVDHKKAGLIGIGLVGSAIARRLMAAGFSLVGHDKDPARMESFVSVGGQPAGSPKDVATAGCRVIVLSLPTSVIVKDVIFGEEGILESPVRPEIIIDTTTGHPDDVDEIIATLRDEGVEYVDSPIAGSSRLVEKGEGVFLAGGNADTISRARHVLVAIGSRIIRAGPPGSGSRAKLAVNLVLGLNRAVLAEGLAFARHLGIDDRTALELFRMTPAYSRAVDDKGEKMLAGDFSPEARLAQHLKDVRIILDLARRDGLDLPFSELHERILDECAALGDGDLDNSAIFKHYSRRLDPGKAGRT